MTSKQTYWAVGNEDDFTCTDSDDAIEEFLNQIDIHQITETDTITVREYKPVKINIQSLDPLDNLLVQLDDKYGGPDFSKPTPKMKKAEKIFIKAIIDEYPVWSCERTGRFKTVNSLEWIRENEPEWLEK